MKMKIALISYEYPPDSAYGGIATYAYQAAKMLHRRGHHVEVFSSSLRRCGTEIEEGIFVHRVVVPSAGRSEKDRINFSKQVGTFFAERHATIQFDVVEGPEYGADAQEVIRLVPEIPLVVKLHTPSFLAYLDYLTTKPLLTRIYEDVRALKYGTVSNTSLFEWLYDPNRDAECLHTLDADEIVAPSGSIGERLVKVWGLNPKKISYFPNPFEPTQEFLDIPVDTVTNVVTFIGRLEARKGILDFAKAIPIILKKRPQTKFRFVGRSDVSPSGSDMRQYLEQKLHCYGNALEFTQVSPDKIPLILAATDVCVFPSIWESFGYVCLEGMAAGRGIVGSRAGGMAEMLHSQDTGRLVPPRSPQSIAKEVIELLENPDLRMRLGHAARSRVLAEYNFDKIGALQEDSYKLAISRRKAMGSRYASN